MSTLTQESTCYCSESSNMDYKAELKTSFAFLLVFIQLFSNLMQISSQVIVCCGAFNCICSKEFMNPIGKLIE